MTKLRRAWARRMLRAGWLLAPILQFPVTAFKWTMRNCFKSFGDFIASVALLAFGWFILCMIYSAYDLRRASPEKITELLNNAGQYRACAVELIPRRMAQYDSPMSVGRVKSAIADCKTANEDYAEMQQQKAAMQQQSNAVR